MRWMQLVFAALSRPRDTVRRGTDSTAGGARVREWGQVVLGLTLRSAAGACLLGDAVALQARASPLQRGVRPASLLSLMAMGLERQR